MAIGENTPNAMVAYFDASPMPNQTMNSGSSAIFGIGNSAETSGSAVARASVDRPIARPTATPALAPSAQPTARRRSEAAR